MSPTSPRVSRRRLGSSTRRCPGQTPFARMTSWRQRGKRGAKEVFFEYLCGCQTIAGRGVRKLGATGAIVGRAEPARCVFLPGYRNLGALDELKKVAAREIAAPPVATPSAKSSSASCASDSRGAPGELLRTVVDRWCGRSCTGRRSLSPGNQFSCVRTEAEQYVRKEKGGSRK